MRSLRGGANANAQLKGGGRHREDALASAPGTACDYRKHGDGSGGAIPAAGRGLQDGGISGWEGWGLLGIVLSPFAFLPPFLFSFGDD